MSSLFLHDPLQSKASLNRRALTAPMDQRRMDADGGRVRTFVVVISLLNVLVLVCLLCTLYGHLAVNKPDYEDHVHIQFMTIADTTSNGPLKFNDIRSSYRMGLVDKKRERIYVNCTGPYIFYMDVCYRSLYKHETSGALQLQVVGSKTPLSTFNLSTSHDVCRGLHSTAYLRAQDQAHLYLYVTDGFKVKNVTVGFSYMLGNLCDF